MDLIWIIICLFSIGSLVLASTQVNTKQDDKVCKYNGLGSLGVNCLNATPDSFSKTPYEFNWLSQTVTCLNCTLVKLPKRTFKPDNNIKILNLCDSHIAIIDPGAFINLPNLEQLFLMENDISEIKKGYFDGIYHIKLLSLSRNKLTSINNNSFPNLNKLLDLDLSCNNIKNIEIDAFSSLKSLMHLNLSYNNELGNIHKIFNNLSSLKIISLKKNKINSLSGDEFYIFNSSLLEIVLSLNNISEIGTGAFSTLDKLLLLDLSHNNLRNLSGSIFNGLTSLQTLNLQFNFIKHIRGDLFEKLVSLRTLNLSFNGISTFKSSYFLPFLEELRNLDLTANLIDFFEIDSVFSFDNLDKFNLFIGNIAFFDYKQLFSRLPRIRILLLTFTKNVSCDLLYDVNEFNKNTDCKFLKIETSSDLWNKKERKGLCESHKNSTRKLRKIEDNYKEHLKARHGESNRGAIISAFVFIAILTLFVILLFYSQYRTWKNITDVPYRRRISHIGFVTNDYTVE